MNIFDCHFHIETGLADYSINPSAKNIIFNTFESYEQNNEQAAPADSITLIFDYRNNFGKVKSLMQDGVVDGLKIHNRLQKIGASDYPVLIEQLQELKPTLPIVIDAFYFGDDLNYQPNLGNIIDIAKAFPNNPIIVAHCGGIETLRYFYHLKSLDNIYFDLSFSLVYLKQTSVFADLKNLIKFGNHDKIMFGTDYPFVSAKLQLDTFLEIAKEMNIGEVSTGKILFSNASGLFKKGEQ